MDFLLFAGIDWGSERHRVCLLDSQGALAGERWIEHSGQGLEKLVEWLRIQAAGEPERVAVAIEVPRGALVETLLEAGLQVFALNPKQLDRFRDRFSPAGAKDDSRDARVWADSVRTDRQAFLALAIDQPQTLRLRELVRLDDELAEELRRATNRLREQFHRYFPQLLQISASADEPWLWSLFEMAPSPAKAARLSLARIDKLLRQHRIRRIDAAAIRQILGATPLRLAPGAAQAIEEHALLLVPRLCLLTRQRAELANRIDALLGQMSQPAADHPVEHRDAAILLSLPGLGRKTAATMLCEASRAIAQRDYHALRSYAGAAPITQQSGKHRVVKMRHAVNMRLRNALYHWARVSVVSDPASKQTYANMRARGHSHGRALRGLADRWLAILIAMLRSATLYDPAMRTNSHADTLPAAGRVPPQTS